MRICATSRSRPATPACRSRSRVRVHGGGGGERLEGDVPALDALSPIYRTRPLVHSCKRAIVRRPVAPAGSRGLPTGPRDPMRASSAFVSQDETSTADGQSQRQSQNEVCYRDYISTSVDPHEQYAYLRERSARDGLAAGQDCTDEREHDDETTLHDHDYDHEQEREQDISAWY